MILHGFINRPVLKALPLDGGGLGGGESSTKTLSCPPTPTLPREGGGGKTVRRGVALLVTLVLLTTLVMMMAAITWQLLAQRRFLDRREHQLQAYWLAQSGLEHAAAKLQQNPKDYTGETIELVPDAEVKITVQPQKEKPDSFLITSEGRFPREGFESAIRSASRVVYLPHAK